MSGKKHCKGVDVVCPFWRCETPLTITCEGWARGGSMKNSKKIFIKSVKMS